MSDQAVVESKATPEVRAEAERMGWIPDTRFKGDPEKFVDADEFLRRGEEVLPIVKKQLATVRGDYEVLERKHAQTEAALKEAQTAIEEIKERHTVETQRAVVEARAALKRQLAAASEAGDHDAIAELTDQMTQLNTADAEAKPVKKEEAKKEDPPPYKPDPEVAEWNKDNVWFGREGDEDRTAFAIGYGQKLRKQGDKSIGREFYDKLSAEVTRVFEGHNGEIVGKVESGRSGGGELRRGGKRSYAALPSEAKDACESEVRSKVGPGKRYKTAEEWRTRYAELYYGQES